MTREDIDRADRIKALAERLMSACEDEPDIVVIASALGTVLGCLGIAHGQGVTALGIAHAHTTGVLNGTLLDS